MLRRSKYFQEKQVCSLSAEEDVCGSYEDCEEDKEQQASVADEPGGTRAEQAAYLWGTFRCAVG